MSSNATCVLHSSFGQVQYAMIGRPWRISLTCSSTSPLGTRMAPGSLPSGPLLSFKPRASTKAKRSPRFILSITSLAVSLVGSKAFNSLPRPSGDSLFKPACPYRRPCATACNSARATNYRNLQCACGRLVATRMQRIRAAKCIARCRKPCIPMKWNRQPTRSLSINEWQTGEVTTTR
jgi:hypothetical protein